MGMAGPAKTLLLARYHQACQLLFPSFLL